MEMSRFVEAMGKIRKATGLHMDKSSRSEGLMGFHFQRPAGNVPQVTPILQVTRNLPLTYLESLCHESLDIRSVEEVDKHGFVRSKSLLSGQSLEGTKYLPVDVRAIGLKLVAIRRNTFINAGTSSI